MVSGRLGECASDAHGVLRYVAGETMPFTITNGAGPTRHSSRILDTGDSSVLLGSLTCPDDCPAPSKGIIVTQYCGTSPPDPTVCLNPETASQCQLGVGADCQACPDNAYCTSAYLIMSARGSHFVDRIGLGFVKLVLQRWRVCWVRRRFYCNFLAQVLEASNCGPRRAHGCPVRR